MGPNRDVSSDHEYICYITSNKNQPITAQYLCKQNHENYFYNINNYYPTLSTRPPDISLFKNAYVDDCLKSKPHIIMKNRQHMCIYMIDH